MLTDDEREAERRAEARIVEWLRKHQKNDYAIAYAIRCACADAIELGEHRKDRT